MSRTHTDNYHTDWKIYLRQEGTKSIPALRVLDLFGGNNILWSSFRTELYFSAEKERGKGFNLHVENRRIIKKLDLSQFNVIDCDSYGTPFAQIQGLFENPTLQKGTVIFYTATCNGMAGLCREQMQFYKIESMVKMCPTLFNGFSLEYFYGLLNRCGVRTVYKYIVDSIFHKEYGYFNV